MHRILLLTYLPQTLNQSQTSNPILLCPEGVQSNSALPSINRGTGWGLCERKPRADPFCSLKNYSTPDCYEHVHLLPISDREPWGGGGRKKNASQRCCSIYRYIGHVDREQLLLSIKSSPEEIPPRRKVPVRHILWYTCRLHKQRPAASFKTTATFAAMPWLPRQQHTAKIQEGCKRVSTVSTLSSSHSTPKHSKHDA